MGITDWPSDLTDDEGVFVTTNFLGPRLHVEGIPDFARDPGGKVLEHYPDSGFALLTDERQQELADLEGTDFLGPRFRDEQGRLDPGAEDRGFFGAIGHEVSSSAAGGVSGAAAGAAEGAFSGLFGDLRNALGTVLLLIVGLVVASLVLGFALPFGGGS